MGLLRGNAFYTKDFDVSLTSVFSNHIDKFMNEQQDFQRGSEKKYKVSS